MAITKKLKTCRKGNTHEKTERKKEKKNHGNLKNHWIRRNDRGKIGQYQAVDRDKNGDDHGNGRSS